MTSSGQPLVQADGDKLHVHNCLSSILLAATAATISLSLKTYPLPPISGSLPSPLPDLPDTFLPLPTRLYCSLPACTEFLPVPYTIMSEVQFLCSYCSLKQQLPFSGTWKTPMHASRPSLNVTSLVKPFLMPLYTQSYTHVLFPLASK